MRYEVGMAFVEVSVEEGPAAPDGLTMRWKTIDAPRVVVRVPWESDDGVAGTWEVHAADDVDGVHRRAAEAVHVEDSADGVVWLVVGGRHGLLLEREGRSERVPYLLLGRAVAIELE